MSCYELSSRILKTRVRTSTAWEISNQLPPQKIFTFDIKFPPIWGIFLNAQFAKLFSRPKKTGPSPLSSSRTTIRHDDPCLNSTIAESLLPLIPERMGGNSHPGSAGGGASGGGASSGTGGGGGAKGSQGTQVISFDSRWEKTAIKFR